MNAAGRAFWEEHHGRKRPIYPNEEVVRFLAYQYPDAAARRRVRALDLGAGSGRHAVLLARLGFDAYAADYSLQAAANVRAFLDDEGLSGRVVCGALAAVPFRAGAFDLVLPWECLFYGDGPAVTRAISEVRRILKPGGLCFTNLRSPEDKHVEGAEARGGGTYVNRDEWDGLTFTVFTEGEARALFADGFEAVWFDRYVVTRRDGADRDAGWTLLLRAK